MKKLYALTWCGALACLLQLSAAAQPHLKCIKLAITNPTDQNRPAEDIVISIPDLKKIAPDFYAGSQIVTTSDAASREEDAAVLKTTELPSQIDALEGDLQPDELAFQIDLKPRQTRIVTITWGPPDRIFRLRGDYPPRTDALFTRKIDGMGWESERNAFRLYFDKRNAIDLYGKTRPSLQLKRYATPGYIYHNASPDGRDIYLVADALGIGAVAGWVNGTAVHVSDVDSRDWRIISTGPVRAIVELTYKGWKVDGKSVNLTSRITQWAGERGFTQTITSDDAADLVFATGLTNQQNIPALRSTASDDAPWLAMWGEQVVEGGNKATSPIMKGTNLGLAVIMAPGTTATPNQDAKDYLLTFTLKNETASWYALAAWDQEGTNDPVPVGTAPEMRDYVARVAGNDAITSQNRLISYVKQIASRMKTPIEVKILSTEPEVQSAPPDTVHPANSRTYKQAIDLLQDQIDRTATKWEPVISAEPVGSVTAHSGSGFFTDGSNETGEWHEQKGFFWTGGFWTGELWKMYARTHDEKYRRWAELWTSRMLGAESWQNHDAGFLYFYSSVAGFEQTHYPKLRESGIRAADRLVSMFNPTTQLIPAWGPGGDDSIIDTMMNLQILWWAARDSGDAKYRDIATKHALRSAEWLVRPDGSVIQSVHYNPGDNRQVFDLHGGSPNNEPFHFSNAAKPGERVFFHTHQGYSWQTSWSRGTAWALYGFTVAYRETHDPRFLQTSQKVADFVIRELPDDGVPWYDFADEGVMYRNRDTSAAAIIADGLLQLSALENDPKKAQAYREQSERIIHSLIDRYLSPSYAGDNSPPGILRHGCGTRPQDGMLTYGQYYLLETLMALQPR
ncbi:MAG: DUF4861 family protein [Terriglobales bacterium]